MSQKNILIITPHADFGDIIGMFLSNESALDVTVATTELEVAANIKKRKDFHYAMLDLELGVDRVLDDGASLRSVFPGIGLIMISRKDPPGELAELRPWKLLKKPFAQSELLRLFRDGLNNVRTVPDVINLNFHEYEEVGNQAWYQNETQVSKTLSAAVCLLNVQEAILFSNESILAQAGKMLPDEIDECSRLVSKFGKEQNATELIKHFQLKTSGRTHFLHATVLAVGIILTLLYDADMPIKVVRGHTRYLTNILKNPLLAKSDLLTLPQISDLGSEISTIKSISPVLPQSEATIATPKHRHPRPFVLGSDLQKAQVQTILHEGIAASEFTPVSTDEMKVHSSTQPGLLVGQRNMATMQTEVAVRPDQISHQSSEWVPAFMDVAAAAGKSPTTGSRFFLRSVEPSLADVIYPCVLIPRLKHQSLEGELKDYLKEELPNIFLAFGWRLESFVIDGAYLQWLARIPPTIAPATHIKIIRTQTSQGILSNFANLNRDNLLKDFWAPGYLLGSGLRLLPADAIAEFIKMNRRQHYLEENTYRVSDVNYPTNHDYWSQSKLNPI